MRQLFTGAALAASLCAFPLEAAAFTAQPSEPEDELVLDDEEDAPAEAVQASDADFDPDDTSFLEEDDLDLGDDTSAAPAGTGGPGKPAAPGSGDGDEVDTGDIDQDALDEKMIQVVSHQPMLNVFFQEGKRKLRFELTPQVGISVNDPYVRHYSAGVEANLWLTNRMALGASFTGFFGQITQNYNDVRYQQGILLTANRYIWEASLGLLYEPFYGKIAVFNRALLHWESYVQLGGGVIQSRVIPRFTDALHQPFTNILPQGNFAIGARLYLPGANFFSLNLGVRTWVFRDVLEPSSRGPNTDPKGGTNQVTSADVAELADPEKAKAEGDKEWAFNSVFFVGFSFYLPPDFNYSTRR